MTDQKPTAPPKLPPAPQPLQLNQAQTVKTPPPLPKPTLAPAPPAPGIAPASTQAGSKPPVSAKPAPAPAPAAPKPAQSVPPKAQAAAPAKPATQQPAPAKQVPPPPVPKPQSAPVPVLAKAAPAPTLPPARTQASTAVPTLAAKTPPPQAPLPDRPPTSTIVQRPAGLPRPASTAPAGVPVVAPVAGVARAGGPTLPPPPATNLPPAGQIPPAPKPAEFKKSPLRFLPFIVAIFLLFGLGYFLYSRFFGSAATQTTDNTQPKATPKQTVITYWGLWEPSQVLQETLADFEQQNPGIKVNYQQQKYQDYRERLQTAIASGKGPDVFRFHASWTPMLRAEVSEVPPTIYSATEYQSTFYPIATQQLTLNNKIIGVPLMYDGLALYYNKEALRTANAEVPQTWTELKSLATRLTLRNGGRVERAGLAIGNATNVDHFGEILGLLILQNGGDPAKPASPEALAAVQYYTDFYTKDKVWDDKLPSSTVAFGRGDVAMMLAPSWRAHEIAAANPNLSFGIAPVPQLTTDKKITWGSYWAESVSAQSKNKDASWKLIKYLSSQEGLQRFHSDASKQRNFGEIYSRVDLAAQLAEQPFAAPYVADAPFAQSWYLNTFTHDNGLNDQILKYYENAITNISIDRGSIPNALSTVDQGVRQVLRQYNLSN